MYRVRIKTLPNKKGLPKAEFGKQVDGALQLKPSSFGGADWRESKGSTYGGVRGSISADPREEANLEAEGGETAFGNISGQNIPDHLKIKGNRHSKGGVPLNLPDDTFIFSDTASMKISDPAILAMFNKNPKKGGYTPAELAKPYDIQKYKGILLDPESGQLERKTAELMIKNMIMKLGALALTQEAKKGFPQGIPAVAKPYMEANGIAEEDLMPELKEQAEQMAMQQQQAMPNPEMQAQQQAEMPDQTMDQDQAMYAQGQQQFPEQMPSGAPVATPQNIQPMQPGMGQEQMMPPQGPMAMYGMEMGGYDMPFYNNPNEMAYGGVPRFDPGGPTGNGVTVNNIPANRTTTAPTEQGWTAGTPVGATGSNAQGWSRTTRQPGQSVTYHSGSRMGTEQGVAQGICAKIAKSGNVEEAILNAFPAYLKGKRPGMAGYDEAMAAAVAKLSANPLYKDCIKSANEKFETKEALYLDETTPEKDCPPCIDPATGQPAVDASGQPIVRTKDPATGECSECTESVKSKKCQCTDPNTGEVKVFDIAQEEECVCEELIQEQGQGQGVPAQQPHWSKNGQLNVLNNALMRTGVAPSNVVIPGRAQTKGAYEEYQTKVDQGLAAMGNMQNAIMYGMSGSTGMKQAQMKDLLGQGVRASMDAVAGVQSRNVDRQRDTNDKSAAIDNANMMARNAVQNQDLQSQGANQNLRTATLNKRDFNTTRAVMDANDWMKNIHDVQMTTPQYGAEYDYGMVYHTGVPKTPNPVGGAATMEDRVKQHMSNGATYKEAYDIALREARLQQSRYGGSFADGGFLYGDVTFPFLM